MIYTKTGDKGQTSLANGQRVAKTDVRIEAYGTVDELNAWVGMLRAAYNDDQLDSIQHKLFNLGAELSQASGEWISESDVKQLESWIDAMQSVVPPQRAFILPMGSEPVVRCHVCRTICRRAERRMIEAEASPESLRFINRLSDYFFVLSRYLTYQHKEEKYVWKK